jgi:hypothetical protein
MDRGKAAAPDAVDEAQQSPGGVVVHVSCGPGSARGHERATLAEVARRLAALMGFAFAGEHDPSRRHPGPVYLVPGDTLVDLHAARALGIRGEDDLFGGVAPHPVAATKAITHPLAAPDAAAPPGWSRGFARRVEDVVLRGFSTFAAEDARRAGRRLLEERGRVRLKPARARGACGQAVVADAAGLDAALAALDPAELARHGLVLEEDLAEVTTHSVGQVRAAGLVASYWGTQRLTPDNQGAAVYGGSDLVVARGGFEALAALDLAPETRLAVAQARAFDAAAAACFPGLVVSRRNYDVAQGLDAAGRRRSGVLEQSWRVGGASGAEIAALEAFRADPALRLVRASTREVYGESAAPPPPRATVYYRGTDEQVGPLTKYALAEPRADP